MQQAMQQAVQAMQQAVQQAVQYAGRTFMLHSLQAGCRGSGLHLGLQTP